MDFNLDYRHWRYRNTALLAAATILLLVFADHAVIRGIMGGISGLGWLGLFFAGFFIVSTFTVVPATLLLSEMSKFYGFWEMVPIVTLGVVAGDYIIFKFIRDTVSEELQPLLDHISEERHIKRLFTSPLFGWLSPLVGAFIIASPLPDEVGLSILGMQQMPTRKFLMLVTVIDFIGIMLLVSLLKSF